MNNVLKLTVAGAMMIAPVLAYAAANDGAVELESYTWGASHRAAGLLQGIGQDARDISEQVSTAGNDLRQPGNIRSEIGKIEANLRRLDSMRNEVVPVEQNAISQAQSMVLRMKVEHPQKLTAQADALAQLIETELPLAHAENEQMYLVKNAPYLQENLGMLEVFGK